MLALFAAITGLLVSHSTRAVAPPRPIRAAPNMLMPSSTSGSSAASFEVLAALPTEEAVQCEEHIREMDAAEALWYRLKGKRCQLQSEGQLRAAQEVLERAERAGATYNLCLDICIEDNLNNLCRAGRIEEADELRQLLKDCEQLVDEHEEQGKQDSAPAEDQWTTSELIEALFEPHNARAEKMAEEGGYLEEHHREMKEIDDGLPRGTIACLEDAYLAAPPTKDAGGV